jgi:hypothetical protein
VSPVFGKTSTVTNTRDNGAALLRHTFASTPNGGTINFTAGYPAAITVLTPLTPGPSLNMAGQGGSVLSISGRSSAVVFMVNACAKVLIPENSISLAAESRSRLGTLIAIVKGGLRSHNCALVT